MASPTTCSTAPPPYISAVSMWVIPRSRPRRRAAIDSLRSRSIVQVPWPMMGTMTRDGPKGRRSIEVWPSFPLRPSRAPPELCRASVRAVFLEGVGLDLLDDPDCAPAFALQREPRTQCRDRPLRFQQMQPGAGDAMEAVGPPSERPGDAGEHLGGPGVRTSEVVRRALVGDVAPHPLTAGPPPAGTSIAGEPEAGGQQRRPVELGPVGGRGGEE